MIARTTPSLARKLKQLLELLSYSQMNGWIGANQFDSVRAHRFALTQVRDSMGVVGAFCWLTGKDASEVSAPLVYVSLAFNAEGARAVHRKVWSQGLTPFLIILTPNSVFVCEGFKYESDQWERKVHTFSWDAVDSAKDAHPRTLKYLQALINLRASRLRSSLFWREYAIDVSGRVDRKLLAGLSDLSHHLIKGSSIEKCLSHSAANGLIGRLLYLYFLADRGIINQEWLVSRGHLNIDLADANASWKKRAFWKLLDDLDSIFNGSIFPLSASHRAEIDDRHIDLAKSVLKHGSQVHANGAVQLSLIDIDFGVLRVETLSAVYEQFLENVKAGERRQVGAYYTPPFLVDLVLDRVEDDRPLEDGVAVLDPSAGSGVFLVGAYRRILERARGNQPKSLSLDDIRGLLVRNIFGVERNPDACHVTAFSLYLTMLDYVHPKDLNKVAQGGDPKKLFPSLLDTNLFALDFFSPTVRKQLPPIKCVVGNPPWQTLTKLGASDATQWAQNHRNCPVGNDQAAELFVWKALREHLAEDGLLAMLIPAKSFVNPTAAKFRIGLQSAAYVCGAINFSHLRHKLFPGAKHPCAAIFVRNRKPSPADWTWVYTPLSISQPIASKDTWPWTLVMDPSAVQQFRHQALAADRFGWFEAFVLRPVDRQIQRYISDSATSGSISLLGELCASIGAKWKRGGNSTETGLPPSVLGGSDAAQQAQLPLPSTQDLFQASETPAARNNDRLSLNLLAKTTRTYRNQFSGNILLVPRNFRGVRFIAYPKAYSSSCLAVFFDKSGDKVTAREKKFLRALAKYLESKTALYFLATTGRRWLMDRMNVEPADFARLPIPFSSLNDVRIDFVLALGGDELERYIRNAFKLDRDLSSALEEFLAFRIGFKDGRVPPLALDVAKKSMLSEYSRVLKRNLDGLIGRRGTFEVGHKDDPETGVGVIVARYTEGASKNVAGALAAACDHVIDEHRRHGSNPFSNSLIISVDAAASTVSIVKPLEYFRWTVDNAFADSSRAMDALMQEAI